jgi:hypothetical protein
MVVVLTAAANGLGRGWWGLDDARHDDTEDDSGEIDRNWIKAFDPTEQLETRSVRTGRESCGRNSGSIWKKARSKDTLLLVGERQHPASGPQKLCQWLGGAVVLCGGEWVVMILCCFHAAMACIMCLCFGQGKTTKAKYSSRAADRHG